jgi:hypothetical protein
MGPICDSQKLIKSKGLRKRRIERKLLQPKTDEQIFSLDCTRSDLI